MPRSITSQRRGFKGKSDVARTTENLLGGLVTQPDPAFLAPGQLSYLRNLVYRNGANGLCYAYGRAKFGAASAVVSQVTGLRGIKFNSGDAYLVALVSGVNYTYAPVGDTGSFSALTTAVASGASLEAVQYQNRYFLMNGGLGTLSGGNNIAVYQSATSVGQAPVFRPAGMLPVVAAPNVTTASGAFSQTATGFYEYWTTETCHFTQDGATAVIESAFNSNNGVSTVLVASTAVVPTIQMPSTVNNSATHWRIYRSPMKSTGGQTEFPIGFMIAELSTASVSAMDTTAVGSASSFASAWNTSAPYADFTNMSAITSADNSIVTQAQMGGGPLGKPVAQSKALAVYGFNLSGVTGTVNGIMVELKASKSTTIGSPPVPITVTIGRRTSTGDFPPNPIPTIPQYNVSKSGSVTATAMGQVIQLGSSTDRWFPNYGPIAGLNGGFVETDFTDGLFMVEVSMSTAPTTVLTTLYVDYIKLYVYYQGSNVSTVVYPTVVYTYGDTTISVSKDFPPPSSNTGDVYQDQLVVNDMNNRSLVRYSFPGKPESFPPTYYLDIQTPNNDAVQCIRVVNNRLVVGMDNSTWRLNYLPSEMDASFDRGDAVGPISRSYGIVNPMCATTFTIDGATYFGQNEQLAFISNKGLCTTDGYNFMVRTKNQDWRQFISLTTTSYPIALVNNPEERCLRFYYRNDSNGNETYLCLHVSYDSGDIDSHGNFKVSGPVHVRNYDAGSGNFADVYSACAVPRSTGNTAIYIGYGGTAAGQTAAGAGAVYFEKATSLPSQDATAQYTTRRIYKAGMSGEWMLGELYGYVGSYTGSPLLTYSFKGTKTNDTGETSRGSKAVTLAGQPMHRVSPKVQVEGLRINCVVSGADSTFQKQMLIFDSTDYGLEDSGR